MKMNFKVPIGDRTESQCFDDSQRTNKTYC